MSATLKVVLMFIDVGRFTRYVLSPNLSRIVNDLYLLESLE